MDSVLFYVPPSVPASQPPRSSSGRATFLPAVAPFPTFTITGNSALPTTAQLSNRNETRKDSHMVKCVDMSDPALPGHLSKQIICRDDLAQGQENSIAVQNSSHLNEDCEKEDDFPTMEQLVSSRWQDSTSASAKPSTANMSKDAPTTMQQSYPTRTENMAREANSRTRDDSPADSSHSTAGTTQDPIILSDDEPEGTESGTDYSDLDFDLNLDLNLTAKEDSRSLHNPDSWLADDDDFDSETIFDSGSPRPASPRSSAATYQTSMLRLDTEGTKRSADHTHTSVFGQLEDNALGVFAEDDKRDGDDAHSTKRRKLTTISLRDPTLNSYIPQLYNSRRDHAQSQQPGFTAAGPQQIEFKSHPLQELRQRGVIRSDPYKRPTSPVKLVTTATTASAALEFTKHDEPPSGSPVAEPNQELKIGNIVGQKNTNDPSIEDCSYKTDVTGSSIGDLLRSPKRVQWAGGKGGPANTTSGDVEEDSPPSSVDIPSRAVAAPLSGAEHESEEIAVHGYLTLKTLQSQVLYCLTFSQESLPRPLEKEQQQVDFMDQSGGLDAGPNQEWAVRNIIGQKLVGEEMHYQVVWEPTWVPESELAGAKKLVDGFVAKSQHSQGGIGAGRGKQAPRAAPGTSRQPDAQGEVGPPKRRGRPRKQK